VREWRFAMLQRRDLGEIRRRLLSWFCKHRRELPWRLNKDPYRIWLSEIMLQQTRVAAVIPFYERFLERFPDIGALAKAPEEEVLRLWSGLGYYSRARNLQRAAQRMVASHGGEFPQTTSEALALPGIGSYTAAAILSIAFGAKHAVLDGNVARVIARLDAIRGDLRANGRWRKLQDAAGELLSPESPSDWNEAMMELGAMICTPRAPQCLLCPIAEFCRARRFGLTDVIPEKRKKRPTVEIALAAAVLLDARGRTLLLPPPHGSKKQFSTKHATHAEVAALVSKMWHFPTVAVLEDGVEELRRFLAKLGVRGSKLHFERLSGVRHAVTYRTIKLLPYRVGVSRLPKIAGTKAVLLSEVVSRSMFAVSNLTRKIAQVASVESDGKD